MPDILDHPKFAAVIRGTGHSPSEITMIKELARHAALEALSASLRVIHTAPDGMQSFIALAALALIRVECDTQLATLEALLAERIKAHEG